MRIVSCLTLILLSLGCGREASLEDAASALFEGRASEAATTLARAGKQLAGTPLVPADLAPYPDTELRAMVAAAGPPTSQQEGRRFLLAPRGLLAAREPAFLWESSGTDRHVVIQVADDRGTEIQSFVVRDVTPYTPPGFSLERGKSYRWVLENDGGTEISDWVEFSIASDEVGRKQQSALQVLATGVSKSAPRSLLMVQFYRRQGLLVEALNSLQYLAKSNPQNPRILLEMAACLAQLGNDVAAKKFLPAP